MVEKLVKKCKLKYMKANISLEWKRMSSFFILKFYRFFLTNYFVLFPISSFEVNEFLQKSFNAEHASTASHTLAPDDDAPRLEFKTKS